MNTDQELLELAAKAAGLTNLSYCPGWDCMAEYDALGKYYKWETYWNPLTHDGNALSLMVKLKITLDFSGSHEFPAALIANYPRLYRVGSAKQNWVSVKYIQEELFSSQDPYDVAAANSMLDEVKVRGAKVAARRAITTAAAEIGKAMHHG